MDILFITVQAIGIIITVMALVETQITSVRWILVIEIAMNVLSGLNYVIQGGYSGLWVCVVASVQALIMYFVNKMEENKRKRVTRVLIPSFSFLYILCCVLTYGSWVDLLPCVAALVYMMAVSQKEILKLKIWMFFNPPIWIFYDVCMKTYTMIFLRVALTIMVGVCIFRIKKGKK